jgi:hypothetical protein
VFFGRIRWYVISDMKWWKVRWSDQITYLPVFSLLPPLRNLFLSKCGCAPRSSADAQFWGFALIIRGRSGTQFGGYLGRWPRVRPRWSLAGRCGCCRFMDLTQEHKALKPRRSHILYMRVTTESRSTIPSDSGDPRSISRNLKCFRFWNLGRPGIVYN